MNQLIGFKNLTYFEELLELNKDIIQKEEDLLKIRQKHHEIASKIKLLSLEEIVEEISSFVECYIHNEYCILLKGYTEEDLKRIEKMYPYLSLLKETEEDNNVYFIKSGVDNYDFYDFEKETY